MDKHQLVTIAVTAAISVVSREIFQWLVAVAKGKVKSETIREKLKDLIINHRRAAIALTDLFPLAYAVWWCFHMVTDQTPINRMEIALIAASVANLLYWAAKIFHDSMDALEEWLAVRRSNAL
jgi:hypothetical protein